MKKHSKLFVPSIIIVTLAVVLLIYFYGFGHEREVRETYKNEVAKRFVCVYSGSSNNYKNSLREGLNKAADELQVGVMFHAYKPLEVQKHCEELDKAIAAKVDGIITNVPDSEAVREYVQLAYNNNIPVILIENDMPDSERISFIGTNRYAYGVHAGKLMLAAAGGNARMAMFMNPGAGNYDLKQRGFMDTLKNYPDMGIELVNITEPSIIEYINATQSVFADKPHINAFYCTDTESTLGVVRAMIEFNKTDNVVIGSGDSDEIIKHVKNGIIYASLVEDPYSIGYLSIECMLKYIMGQSVSESVNPQVLEILKENADDFLAERKDKN